MFRGAFQLVTNLPAAVPARLLGIHITFAWPRASAGDWAAYTADKRRRSQSKEARLMPFVVAAIETTTAAAAQTRVGPTLCAPD